MVHVSSKLVFSGVCLLVANKQYYNYLVLYVFYFSFTGTITDTHDSVADAITSIKLYKKYYHDPAALLQAKQKLLFTPISSTTWRKRNNYQWEGVCMAAFMPSKCFCSAPTFRKD